MPTTKPVPRRKGASQAPKSNQDDKEETLLETLQKPYDVGNVPKYLIAIAVLCSGVGILAGVLISMYFNTGHADDLLFKTTPEPKLEKFGNIAESPAIASQSEGEVKGLKTFPATDEGRKAYFAYIYEHGIWGSGKPGGIPKSGAGSTLQATETFAGEFIKFLLEQTVYDFVDIGCGDMTWMREVLRAVPNVVYHGVDVVPQIIDDNRRTYFGRQTEFLVQDALIDTIPRRDVIFTRNLFQHMLSADVLQALKKISRGGGIWFVASTYPKVTKNFDTTGFQYVVGKTYFHWNLEIEPFNLGDPVGYLNDTYEDRPLGIWSLPLWLRGSSPLQLKKWDDTPEGRKELFDAIYAVKHWGSKDDPGSGQGSNLPATNNIRNGLLKFFEDYEIKSMVDIPCGDMTWMPLVLKQAPDLQYLGVDIVTKVIDDNTARLASDKIKFKRTDAVLEILPKVDVIFCREMLQHILRDSSAVIVENFKKSGSKWLLATTFPATKDNWDTTAMKKKIDMFIFWPWNLEIAPFNLGKAVECYKDTYDVGPMCLWRINE